ncbi:MAG TPA: hypothetical protein PLM56_12950 [Cyclobacteriaceae bacterium]|nr:hypothetical protein [Cyclobacteriaceae bacterium]HRF34405.1 hypothetical protein [Cyclobacteriaceae bacterium]
MKYNISKYFFFFLLALFTTKVQAQDWVPLFHPDSLQSVHIVMDVMVYEKATDKSPFFEGVAEVKRTATCYFSSFSGLEMLMSDQYLIMTNLADRSISVSRRDKEGEQAFAKDMMSMLDSMLRTMSHPQKIEETGERVHYQYIPVRGEIKVIDIYLSKADRKLQQITYRYESGQFARTVFKKFETKAVFETSDISEARYFSSLTDKVTLQERYTRFRVIWN